MNDDSVDSRPHGAVRAHLTEESEPGHNLVIQFDKLFFGKRINVDRSHPFNLL